ncbi:MAG: DinB family protein [Anaerolineae bacterium]|nr:DinB family protein [Anaerolineae bacterium]
MEITSKTLDNAHRRIGHAEGEQSQASVDRMALQTELEGTRTAFHTFLNALSADRWHQKSPGSAWTMAEVAVHLTWALEQLPQEIASARRGQGMFNSPSSLAWLADQLSYWMIRWMARKVTPEVIRRRYDAAMTAVLHTLDGVTESDWVLGASFYGHGFYSIADLFHTPAEHFAEHTADR